MAKRLQNKVAESRYTLTFMAFYGVFVWYLAGAFKQQSYFTAFMAAVATFLMMELNNSNALIRIYSRMVSSSFVALICMAPFLFLSVATWVVVVSLLAFYLIIFRTYQDEHSPGVAFYAFLCLGIGSLLFVQILFFVPFIWLFMKRNLMAFGAKMFCASLIGLIVPYWFLSPFLLWKGQIDLLWKHFCQLATFQPLFQYNDIDLVHWLVLGFTIILLLVGVLHFFHTSYLDKIRTRMLYQVFFIMALLAIVFLFLQPQHFNVLFGIIIISTSTFIGHYFALTKSRVSNVIFCVLAVFCLLVTLFNLWNPLLFC